MGGFVAPSLWDLAGRVGKYIGGQGTVQAAPPPSYPSQIPSPAQQGPIMGPPASPTFPSRVGSPPSSGQLGALPAGPSGGSSPGWMSVPAGAHFDSSILAPPPDPGAAFNGIVTSPGGTSYNAVPHGSTADLESQISAKSYIDRLYPQLTPEGRLHETQVEQQTRELTPLRPGEQVAQLPQEARAEQKRSAAFSGLQSAMQDWTQRRQAATQALQSKGLSREALAQAMMSLDDAFDQEKHIWMLRFAPELVQGFKAGLQDTAM